MKLKDWFLEKSLARLFRGSERLFRAKSGLEIETIVVVFWSLIAIGVMFHVYWSSMMNCE